MGHGFPPSSFESLPLEELAQGFFADMGRPLKDLPVVLGALILQQMHDLSDAATVEAISFNLAWHYALDIRMESDAYICEQTLRNYRRMIIDKGLDEVLFRGLTDRLIEAFGVDVKKQRVDSTSVRSAMRPLIYGSRFACLCRQRRPRLPAFLF